MARPRITEESYRTAFQSLIERQPLEKISAYMLQKEAGGRFDNAMEMFTRLFKEEQEKQERAQEAMPKPEWYMSEAKEAGQQVEQLILSKWSEVSQKLSEHEGQVEDNYRQKEQKYQSIIESLEEQNRHGAERVTELEQVEEMLEGLTTTYNQQQLEASQASVRMEESVRNGKELKQQIIIMAEQRDEALKDKSELSGQLETTSGELADARTQADKLHTGNGELTQSIVDLEKHLKTTIEEKEEHINKMDTILQETQQTTIEARESLSGIKSTLTAREEKVQELTDELKDLKKDNLQLTRQIGKLDGQLTSINKDSTKKAKDQK